MEISVKSESNLTWKSGTFTDYEIKGNKLCFVNNNYSYSVELEGSITKTDAGFVLSGDVKKILF